MLRKNLKTRLSISKIEWSIFRTPDFNKIKELLKQPVIFDGRNLYDVEDMQKEGFYYSSIGRKNVN